MGGFKILSHLRNRTIGHLQSLVRAFITQVRHNLDTRLRNALAHQLLQGSRFQGVQAGLHLCAIIQITIQLPLTQAPHIREPHAIGRKHPSKRMHHHSSHAQRFSHQTGMLPPRATKTLQGIGGNIMAALNTDFFDGIGHILNSNFKKSLRHVFQ